jgi:hypothetical protein
VPGVSAPPTAEQLVRFMLSQSLHFDLTPEYVYSNFGYYVIGRVSERVTGLSHRDALPHLVLAPSGISDMQLSRTRLEDRAGSCSRIGTSCPGPTLVRLREPVRLGSSDEPTERRSRSSLACCRETTGPSSPAILVPP